jgi:flagellar FliL protein
VASVAGAAWRLGLLAEQSAAEAKLEEPVVGALLPLDPFIANLADEDGRRYLKATLQVEFFGARVPDEFTARVPQMRDLLLTLLTSKFFTEVRTPEGKAVLRTEVVNRMNRTLNKDLVKAVYFTEFIVQ